MDFNAWITDITGFLSRYSALFLGGLRNTLIAGVLSIFVGGGLCVLRMSKIAPLRWIANIWIEFVRGTPVLVQIMLVYYGLPMIGINPPVPAFLGSAGNRVMYGIIALTIYRHAGSVCILRYLGTWPGTVPYQGVRQDGHRDRVRLYAV